MYFFHAIYTCKRVRKTVIYMYIFKVARLDFSIVTPSNFKYMNLNKVAILLFCQNLAMFLH